VNNENNKARGQPSVTQHAETKVLVSINRDETGTINIEDNCSESCKKFQSLLKARRCRWCNAEFDTINILEYQ
jgi:hypothetical protein